MRLHTVSVAATAALFCCCCGIVVASTAAEQPAGLTGEKLAELMQLSLDEIKSRMESVFALVDSDGDGILTEEEVREWSIKLKDGMHRHQVKQEFSSIDKNSDGKVTLEELEASYTDGADIAQQQAHKEDVRKRFDAVDKDKSGGLTLEEVTLLMDPGKDDVLMQIEVEEIMNAQDKDKDGAISIEEFMSTEGGSLSEQEKEELTTEFKNYDIDADGKIDNGELRAVIRDPHAHELQLMLQSLANEMKDGQITKQYWEENYQSLAVSIITDNGELLRFPEEYDKIGVPFKGINPSIEEEGKEKREEL